MGKLIERKILLEGTDENGDKTLDFPITKIGYVEGADEYTKNPLFGKKVSFLGDSICAGGSESYVGGYGKIIAERNGMVYENVARGGALVTAETYSKSTGNPLPWLCRMVANMSEDADYAIIEGGLNDGWYTPAITMGKITNGYNADLDETTFYGAFESMLKQLVTKFQGKKIGYIAVPKIHSLYDSERNAPNFYHIAMECCAKWGVPVCDLNTITPPVEYLKKLGTDYTVDGTHPTLEGYLKYYCDPIEAWMKTLTTGGNNTATMVSKAMEEYAKGFNDAIQALQNGKLNNTGVSFRKAKLPLADGTTIEIDVLTAVDGTIIAAYANRVPISIDTDGSVFNEVGYKSDLRLSSSGTTKDLKGSVVTGFIPAKAKDVIRVWNCNWGTVLTASNYLCAYDSNFNFIGAVASTIGVETLTLAKYGTNILSDYSVDETFNTTITLANVSNIAYIRVSSIGNIEIVDGSKMIITVNEEIK